MAGGPVSGVHSGRGGAGRRRGGHGSEGGLAACRLAAGSVLDEVTTRCHAPDAQRRDTTGQRREAREERDRLRTGSPKAEAEAAAAAAAARLVGVAGRVREEAGSSKRLRAEGVTRLMRLAVGAAQRAWWSRQ